MGLWDLNPQSMKHQCSALLIKLIYVNDIIKATNTFSMRLFADDTSLTVIGNDLDQVFQIVNEALTSVFGCVLQSL